MLKIPGRMVAMLLICAICAGCASRYGEQQTVVNYYPACYAPLQDLRDREYDVGKTTGTTAVLGALGGALIGLLATGGKAQGALVGAAAGGAAGAVGGNIYAKRQRAADDNMRMASYMQHLEGNISQLDLTAAAARTSLQCYDRQFAALLKAIRARSISRDAASQRFAEISSGREEAIALLDNAASYAGDLGEQYEAAFRQEEETLEARSRSVSPAATRRARAALSGAKSRQRELSGRRTQLTREKNTAQEDTARQLRELQSAFDDLRA